MCSPLRKAFVVLACLVGANVVGGNALAQSPSAVPATRGELLYSTHCVECHNTQMHWRANSVVRDWTGLKAQVRRWQGNANLGWSESDIDDVARHLNASIYRLPSPREQATLTLRQAFHPSGSLITQAAP